MMKRRIAALLATAAVLCMLLLTALPVSAARAVEDYIPNVGLYDAEGLFTPAQQEELTNLIQQTSRNIDMYAAVVILNQSGAKYDDEQTESYARSSYIKYFESGVSYDTDGVLLVLNMSSHYIYITTSGLGMMYYNNDTDGRCDRMQDNLKPQLRANDNVGAVKRFCSDLEAYYMAGIPEGSYGENKKTGEVFYVENGEIVKAKSLPFGYGKNFGKLTAIALAIGAVVALITYAIIKSSYKLKKSLDPSNYISQKETNFYEKHDVFVRAHTTKTRIDTDSGGHGGGGSISSFGGHSFGGGGSHW